MKIVLSAKQGLGCKFLFSFIQCLIVSPISALISFIFAVVCNYYFETKQSTILFIVFIILNLLWIIRNSFVVFENGKLKFKDPIGKTVTVDCEKITDLRVLDSSSFRELVLSTDRTVPLLTNCLNIFSSVNNVIIFKKSDNRTVAIGVHNHKKLISCLEKYALKGAENSNSVKTEIKHHRSITDYYFINMPLKSHLECYFKNYVVTVIYPLVASSVLFLIACVSSHPLLYIIISVLIFIGISARFYFFDIITVKMSVTANAIRLDCNSKDTDNVIKYEYIKELRYLSSLEESKELFNNKEIKLIKTPHPYTLWKNVIFIELQNGAVALLSVKRHEKLYNTLFENRKTDNKIDRIDNSKIAFKTRDDGIIAIKKNDIICVEVSKKQVCVTTVDCQLITKEKMDFFKERLTDPCFTIPHNSYIINFNFVTSYKRDSVLLSNQQIISVAPKRQAETKKKYMNFIGKND